MIVGDDRESLEAISGGEDLATGFFKQSLGGATNRFAVVDHHDLQATNFYCVVAAHTLSPVCKIHVQSAARHNRGQPP